MLSSFTFGVSLEKLLPQAHQKTFLLAVSGGVDSMVLLDLCHQLQLSFEVAHVNYHLRNEDSNLDQNLVESWCEKNKIKFHLYDVSEKDKQPENSIENWAREIRYRFFKEILIKNKLDFLVTAHHLNDQLETFVINLSKAAGLKGLKGIPEKTENIIRPLLEFSREEIEVYAKQNQIEYREDYTNAETIFVRNKIRNQITPLLNEVNKDFLENFKTSISIIKESKDFIDSQIDFIFENLVKENSVFLILDKTKLAAQSYFVKYEILTRFGFNNKTEIEKIFEAENGKSFKTNSHHIKIGREELLIQSLENEIKSEEFELNIIETADSVILKMPDTSKFSEWEFDAKLIKLPLRLRQMETGDIFFPKDFNGKKKVSKFIKDEKLNVVERSVVHVLVDSNNQILGIFPLRQDRRFLKI
ncbi:tRNA lysidine(34) synthetase TilS [Soonwooa sp.]|uniref:tRNA lysidine(34) synthetase TilS n=1 Tax=Soonwooa sp. TaxID=1938592 RepID=UPI0028974A57|nr:tRNA lysidine(34) synthetase TilS [Soonwooa sp.]